jgi:hypothetical protein
MDNIINENLLRSLVEQVETFRPVVPAGNMHRMIREIGFYEERGVIFVYDDFAFSHLYAGLAVLARDIHRYLSRYPRSDALLFMEMFSPVNAEEGARFRSQILLNHKGPPAKNGSIQLSSAAALGQPTVAPLGGQDVIHEWTFKPGKKLFVRFLQKSGARIIETVFCKDGPYEQFKKGLLDRNALSVTIAGAILTESFSPQVFWYPLAVYLSLLLYKTSTRAFWAAENLDG